MHLSVLGTAILSLAGIALAVNVDASGCSSGPFIAPTKTGLEWGNVADSHYFCEGGWLDGDLLTGIRVWRGDWGVWGVAFLWGKGDWGKVYGTDTDGDGAIRDPDQELKWEPGQDVEIKLWPNIGKNDLDGVGWIQVWIGGEKKLTQGSEHTGDEVKFSTSTKKIVALSGKAASQVGQKNLVEILQFHYLESSIQSAVMTNMEFGDELNKYNAEQKGIDKSASLGSVSMVNGNAPGGLNQTFSIAQSITYTQSRTITSQWTNSFSYGLSIKTTLSLEIPGVIKEGTDVTHEFKYSHEQMNAEADANTDTKTLAVTMGSTAQGTPPGSATVCKATAVQGTFESDYSADITAKLANGKTFVYKEYGHMKSISYVDATMQCETVPSSQVPSDSKIVPGVNVGNSKRGLPFVA